MKETWKTTSRKVNANLYDSPDSVFSDFFGVPLMAMEDTSNAELLKLWKTGNQRAAQILIDRYMLRLTALARSRLSQKLARRIDADDVVLSAWRSFFVAVDQSRLHVPDDDNLWPLLVTLALRKLHRQAQRHLADRRSVRREVSISDEDTWQEIVSGEPTPEHAGQLTCDLEILMARLNSQDREILARRLQGEELESIATQLSCSERTVRRAMQRIRDQLKDYFAHDTVSEEISVSHSNCDIPSFPQRSEGFEGRSVLADLNPSMGYGDLVLDKLIGQGGFGKVYRARLKSTGQLVAVKSLNKRLWRHAPSALALINETLKVSSISNPHIVHHYGWGLAPSGAPFIVMELMDGPSLQEWIRSPAFDHCEIVTCGLHLCDALSALHRAGMIHGDIAPGNVLRRRSGDFVLTDFGLSRSAGEIKQARGGTAGFLAPEQISAAFGTISERTDIYGLGGLLYFLATQQAPFIGRNVPEILSQILSSHPPASMPLNSGLPRSLCRLIMACLSKEPLQRFPDVDALRDALLQSKEQTHL